MLSSGFQAVGFLIAPPNTDSTAWLTWIANHAERAQLAKVFDVLAMPFLVATAPVYIMLGRKRSPRLAWIAGVALGAGLVGLAVLHGWQVLAYNLVTDRAVPPATVASAVDGIASSPAGFTAMALYMGLGTAGLLGTLFSLWRSRAVPRVAVLLLLGGSVTDVAGRGAVGDLISLVGVTWVAATIVRGGGSPARPPDLASLEP